MGKPNNEIHLLLHCPSVGAVKKQTGVSTFLNLCRLSGLSDSQSFTRYVNGLDTRGKPVSVYDYLSRGRALKDITEDFLKRW